MSRVWTSASLCPHLKAMSLCGSQAKRAVRGQYSRGSSVLDLSGNLLVDQ